jgi:hypothetical protein
MFAEDIDLSYFVSKDHWAGYGFAHLIPLVFLYRDGNGTLCLRGMLVWAFYFSKFLFFSCHK